MKERWFLHSCLVICAAIALLVGPVDRSAANTELVPAARLVAPFFDISPGRDTFLILANVSRWVKLDGTTFACGRAGTCGPFMVHLEFYGQSCERIDYTTLLTPGDIDVIDLGLNAVTSGVTDPGQALGPVSPSSTQSGLRGRGWVDIDVRFCQAGVCQESDPGVQANVLVGTVLIVDIVTDVATTYPMAPSMGIADHGLLGRIVRRDPQGRAIEWTGRYEPFPNRLFVPAFFAEGQPPLSIFGKFHAAFLALAAPADGNWDGSGNGEAPGQRIGPPAGPGAPLINVEADVFDGCESSITVEFASHYVNNFLSLLMPALPQRPSWTDAKCGASFPGRDELSNGENGGQPGQPVGWIDLQNAAIACDQTTPGPGASNCPAYSSSSTVTDFHSAGVGTGQRRGMVGVLLESESFRFLSPFPGVRPRTQLLSLTASRLWGDRSPWIAGGGRTFPDLAICASPALCHYSFANTAFAEDIAAQGSPADAVPSDGGEFP